MTSLMDTNRHKSAADWAESDYVLPAGMAGYDDDTGAHKYGDGIHTWAELPYPEESSDLDLVAVNEDGDLVRVSDGEVIEGGSGGSSSPSLTMLSASDAFDYIIAVGITWTLVGGELDVSVTGGELPEPVGVTVDATDATNVVCTITRDSGLYELAATSPSPDHAAYISQGLFRQTAPLPSTGSLVFMTGFMTEETFSLGLSDMDPAEADDFEQTITLMAIPKAVQL